MSKDEGHLPKESSMSNRKSQQRSSSASRSKASKSSRSSCSSVGGSSRRSKTKKPRVYDSEICKNHTDTEIIYDPEEYVYKKVPDDWPHRLTQGLEVLITCIVLTACIYHGIWGRSADVAFFMIEMLLLEVAAIFLIMHVSRSNSTGSCCLFTAYQFALLFSYFSVFLTSQYVTGGRFFDVVLSQSNVTILATVIHLSIVLECMELIGQSNKRRDYSSRIIVEAKEKRKTDMYQMVHELIKNVASVNPDVKMKLVVTDETGRPMQLFGSAVEATTNSAVQLSCEGGDAQLTFIKTAEASVTVPPKRKNHIRRVSSVESLESVRSVNPPSLNTLVNASVYNACRKQNDNLSPRKIL